MTVELREVLVIEEKSDNFVLRKLAGYDSVVISSNSSAVFSSSITFPFKNLQELYDLLEDTLVKIEELK